MNSSRDSSMSSPPITFHETQFVALPGQRNVYGLVSLPIGGTNQLVVAMMRGEIFSLEFHKSSVRPVLSPLGRSGFHGNS